MSPMEHDTGSACATVKPRSMARMATAIRSGTPNTSPAPRTRLPSEVKLRATVNGRLRARGRSLMIATAAALFITLPPNPWLGEITRLDGRVGMSRPV